MSRWKVSLSETENIVTNFGVQLVDNKVVPDLFYNSHCEI